MFSSKCCCPLTVYQQSHSTITTRCTPGWHRRQLPDSVIALNTDKGKRLFREALLADGLHGYFSLAETFHTQSEPSYCGPGTLSMVLNSLNIDPGHLWKGNWRFFDETVLRTCDQRKPHKSPLENIIEKGLTFEEFIFLTECNGGSIIPFPATYSSLGQFRSAILVACTRYLDDIRLVCSYDRGALRQTGSGHFSPIAGYHVKEDLILILDVARFKYPPYWVSVELLWQSMTTIDSVTGKSRGFYLIAKWPTDFSIDCSIRHCKDSKELLPDNVLQCSQGESFLSFIELIQISENDTIESIIIAILQSLPPAAVQLITKWTFDVVQKYRLAAVWNSTECFQQNEYRNLFESYPSFLPHLIDMPVPVVTDIGDCIKPCSQVTLSHVHVYAIPTEYALQSFVLLLETDGNRELYQVLERMHVEQYLRMAKDKSAYLFGALSPIINGNEKTATVERARTAVLLYALRTSKFLSNVQLFDWTNLSTELQDEVNYARAHLGL